MDKKTHRRLRPPGRVSGPTPPQAPRSRLRGRRNPPRLTTGLSWGAAVAAALLLAACGKQQPLKPVAGQAMPPKPANSPMALTVDQLLDRPPQTRPERVDELLRKSEERRDDHFDLPPAG